MKEIVEKGDPKFMASNVTDGIKSVIKRLCHRLYEKNQKLVNYIEVGIWYGGTFKEILNDCKDIKIHGYGIDFFEDFDKLNGDTLNTHVDPVITVKSAIDQYEAEGFTNFTLIKGDSVESLNSLKKMENVVCFIDANHTYDAVKADFLAAAAKIKNGYICLDDCNYWEDPNGGPGSYGIWRFHNEIKNQYKIVYQDIRNVAFKIR